MPGRERIPLHLPLTISRSFSLSLSLSLYEIRIWLSGFSLSPLDVFDPQDQKWSLFLALSPPHQHIFLSPRNSHHNQIASGLLLHYTLHRSLFPVSISLFHSLFSLSLPLSIYLSIYLSISLSIYIYTYDYLDVAGHLSIMDDPSIR